jgi:hypothetical protein
MANEQPEGIGKVLMDAAQVAGDAMANAAGKGLAMGLSGIGALIGMIPGLGGLGEGLASAAGRGGDPMDGNHRLETTSPIIASQTPAHDISGQSQPAATMTLPAAAFAAVEAIKNNPIVMDWASPSQGQVLSNLALVNTPAVELNTGKDLGRSLAS